MGGRIIRPESGSGMLALPEVGRLHIGAKSEKGYPMSLDWFRPTGRYAGLFTKALGEKPQTIQIIFPDDDPAEVCNERYEFRDNTGALVAHGDGRLFLVWDGKRYQPYSVEDYPDIREQITRNYPKKPRRDDDDGWDIVLTMKFIVPAVRGVVGVWKFSTKGEASSIKNIRDSFDGVQMLRGTVTSTVFDLSVQFVKSNKPGSNSRYPVVTMVANDNRVSDIKAMLKPSNGTENLLING